MIEPQQVQQGGVEVMNRNNIFDGAVTEVIRGTVNRSATNATSRQPQRKAPVVVITSLRRPTPSLFHFHGRGPAEFAGADDQRLIEQPALLEIDVADFCTPTKNHLAGRHTHEVIDPLLQRLRPHVAFTMFSMRAGEQEVDRKMYRSIRHSPTPSERLEGRRQITEILSRFQYTGQPLPAQMAVSKDHPVRDYFRQFPGLDAGSRYNNVGFWELPVPVCSDVTMHDDDVVIGYAPLRDFLQHHGVRHVLLTSYATDMCFCETTAGYENLSRDFNVFLVGDATLATFPANDSPKYATNAAISFASLNQLITQTTWIRHDGPPPAAAPATK